MAYTLFSYHWRCHLSFRAFCTFYLIWSSWWFLQWWPKHQDKPIFLQPIGTRNPTLLSLPFTPVIKISLWSEKSHHPHCLDLHFFPSLFLYLAGWGAIGRVYQVTGMGLGLGQEERKKKWAVTMGTELWCHPCLLLDDFLGEEQQAWKGEPRIPVVPGGIRTGLGLGHMGAMQFWTKLTLSLNGSTHMQSRMKDSHSGIAGPVNETMPCPACGTRACQFYLL